MKSVIQRMTVESENFMREAQLNRPRCSFHCVCFHPLFTLISYAAEALKSARVELIN